MDEVALASGIDPWFVDQIAQVVEEVASLRRSRLETLGAPELERAKRIGLSDRRLAVLTSSTEAEVRRRRTSLGRPPRVQDGRHVRGRVPARDPVPLLDVRGAGPRCDRPNVPRVVILGAGPNRIGQGIEFDYACVHAAFALGEAGFESVMVNSNPETVSTDYDTSARLYFEPLSTEDVLAVCEAERPIGVIASSAGRRRCGWPGTLEAAGFPVLGTPRGLDRPGRGSREVRRAPARARHPGARARRGETTSRRPGRSRRRSGTPSWCDRPTCSAGARWRSSYDADELERFVATRRGSRPDHPVLIDRFLEGAIEVDVDAVCDGTDVFVGAVMEHIEEAGIHSGDSSCQIRRPRSRTTSSTRSNASRGASPCASTCAV